MITPRDGQSVPDQSTGLRGLKSLGVFNLKPGVFAHASVDLTPINNKRAR